MLVVITLIFICFINIEGRVTHISSTRNENLEECVNHILRKYFSRYLKLTYVGMGDEELEIIKKIDSTPVILRNQSTITTVPDESYLIIYGNTTNIMIEFKILVKEFSWNPYAKFLIITKNSDAKYLKQIFDALLRYHVLDVLVVNNNYDPDLYTYNPFENYGCGKRYDRVIEHGKCSKIRSKNLYRRKLETGLRKCFFKIFCSHYPPYVIEPSKSKQHLIGVEEFILREISALEHFTVNISYKDESETFSIIGDDTSAEGPLRYLQTSEADIVMGALVLTYRRAKIFNYIHMSSTDLRILVKTSSIVPDWKNLYLEFNAIIWLALVFTFLTYFLIFILIVKPKDKTEIILRMLEGLFFGSKTVRGNRSTKYIWILWVIFAYLINTYYQSSLVSLANNPSKEYQISSEEDVYKYNLKPCLSKFMRSYLQSVHNFTTAENPHADCDSTFGSIEAVSQSNDVYTIVMRTSYLYYQNNFLDNYGDPMIHMFKEPSAQIRLGIYLYKGFPMLEKLKIQALRLTENGLLNNYVKYMQWMDTRKFNCTGKKQNLHLPMPLYILGGGYLLSTCVFLVEILIKKLSTKKLSLVVLRH